MTENKAPEAILDKLRAWLWGSLRVLWLCAYASISVAAVGFVFVANDQGADLLRISAEPGHLGWNLSFAGAALLLGLALWYSARLLLGWDQVRQCVHRCLEPRRAACRAACDPSLTAGTEHDEPVPHSVDTPRDAAGRIWLPRVFGMAIPALIGLGFLVVDTPEPLRARVLGAIYLVLAALLGTLLVKRRDWFLGGSRGGLEELTTGPERRRMVLVLTAALVAGAVLSLAFMLNPVALPRALGAPAILLLGLAGIALFGGLVLTYAFLANDQMPGTTLALLVAVLVGLYMDNHWIRRDPAAPPPPRLPAAERLAAWDAANPPHARIDGRRPVIIVAAAGGGIRAAYWTGSVLAHLEATPGFSQGLFAVSGVSGGSVGAAVYTAVRQRQLASGLDSDTLATVRAALRQDFLSPVVAGLLFPDLVQRFVPYPVAMADRQRFMEVGFESALGPGPNPLAQPFTALYAGPHGERLPNLLLNATVVDSGRRAVFSSIALDGFTDTLDLMRCGFDTREVLLSAAAGASARFTYVSPAGSLRGPGGHTNEPAPGAACPPDGAPDAPPRQKIRLVDGGYFENSGAATAVDLLNRIQVDGDEIYPILILIRNDPAASPVCLGRQTPGSPLGPGPAGDPAQDLLSEVASPVRALLNGRTARGRLAEVDAANRFEGYPGAVVELSLGAVARAEEEALRTRIQDPRLLAEALERLQRRLVEPPLGWSLSAAARAAMDRTLDTGAGGIGTEIANLKRVLAGDSSDYLSCGAR